MTHLLRKGRAPQSALNRILRRLHAVAPFMLAALSLIAGRDALAQTSGRPEAPLVLRLPASARYAAMANAGVSGNDGDVIFYNPGMLAQARGVAVSVQRYGSRATTGSFGSVQTLGSLTVGVGAQTLDYGAPAYDDLDAAVRPGSTRLSDGGPVSASSSAFTVGVARTIKGLRLGASVKYAEERLADVRDGSLAFDVGINRAMGPAILSATIQNLGASPSLGSVNGALPTRVTVGFGGGLFPIWERWDIGMQSQVSVERDGFVRPAGGVEVGYVPVEGVAIVLRQGLRLPRERDESLVTAGVGVNVDRFSLDYAMEPTRGGRPVSHRVGVRIR
jgi:hypothetical protein